MSEQAERAGANEHRLSTQRSFVIRFHADSARERHNFEGRLEHVVTNAAARFRGADELLAALERGLEDGKRV